VGSSLPDNKLVKLHDFLFVVAWMMLGERGFLSQRQTISLRESLAPVVGSLKLASGDVILWMFRKFHRF